MLSNEVIILLALLAICIAGAVFIHFVFLSLKRAIAQKKAEFANTRAAKETTQTIQKTESANIDTAPSPQFHWEAHG